MKNKMFLNIVLVVVFVIYLSNCSRRNDNAFIEAIPQIVIAEAYESAEQALNRTMFVNAPAGLRVRSSPSIDGEVVGLLVNLTEAFAVKQKRENITIDGIDGNWTFISLDTIQGWVFNGFLTNNIAPDPNEISGHDNETVEHNPLNLDLIMHRINRARSLKEYFYLSGEYFCIEDKTLLRIFSNSLGVSTADGKGNDPNYGSFWFGAGIITISHTGDDFILTVMDPVGFTDWEVLREERQIMLTSLGSSIYEINILSPVVSQFLNFLDGKQFRKAQTFSTPSHAIALYDIIDDFGNPTVISYENEEDEKPSWRRLFSGTLVTVVEFENTNSRNQRARVRFFSHRSLVYAWIYARNLVEF